MCDLGKLEFTIGIYVYCRANCFIVATRTNFFPRVFVPVRWSFLSGQFEKSYLLDSFFGFEGNSGFMLYT